MNEFLFGIVIVLTLLLVTFNWIDFLCFLVEGHRVFKGITRLLQVVTMLGPILLFGVDQAIKNSCCGETATFSPDHRLSVTALALLCLGGFFYSAFRRKLAPPLLEVIVNCLLLCGIVLDFFVGVQLDSTPVWLVFILPVAFQLALTLAENHRLAIETLEATLPEAASSAGETLAETSPEPILITFCRGIVFLRLWQKIPLFLLLSLPILTLLVAALLLFGQKPDSFVRAFTDTYKQGFSQLDYQCAGVVCGGHFLCTIAARGNPGLVKPIRVGIRAGRLIQCNRQLLVSNAFEELLEQRLPWLHRPVRAIYNRIGDAIHRRYDIFDNQWVSNGVYLLMKPLEWIFTLTLYLADRNPESRIAQQYLHWEHRRMIAAGADIRRPGASLES